MVLTIRACAVTLTAVAMVTVAGAAASAPISENTIMRECRGANHGTYTTMVYDGVRYSTCTYRDIDGNRYRDYYQDGEYYSTREWR
jgi:hypothetical protein